MTNTRINITVVPSTVVRWCCRCDCKFLHLFEYDSCLYAISSPNTQAIKNKQKLKKNKQKFEKK